MKPSKNISKDKDTRLKEKEKLEAELQRSLSAAKVKEAHKQIEDIEKERKRSAIFSISKRIESLIEMSQAIINATFQAKQLNPKLDLKKMKIENDDFAFVHVNTLMSISESIKFDLEKNLRISKQDFDRLFPNLNFTFDTYDSIENSVSCLILQLIDMHKYCLRLM